jgi:hypothetical protein
MYSSPDWMIALAVFEKADRIDLYGVDVMQENAPEHMRAGTALWIGVALSRGVEVKTFPGSFYQYYTNPGIAMEQGLYGYVFKPRIEQLARQDIEGDTITPCSSRKAG